MNKKIILSLVIFALGFAELQAQQSAQIRVQVGPNTLGKKVDGRLLVFFSKRNRQAANGPNWFGPEPFFGLDVKNVGEGDTIVIDDSADGFPGPISKLEPGSYYVQAILDHDFYFANHANGPGNVTSQSKKIEFDGKSIDLELTEVVEPRPLKESKWTELVTIESKLLQDHFDRPVTERALVVLPPSYFDNPEKRYPVYYVVTGFGGTLVSVSYRSAEGQRGNALSDVEFIEVYLTGQCKMGHHVYANSAGNGPRGDALVEEMIPAIDKKYRTIAEPTARFVGGHSSGGWSSLWLQVNYPETFGGVWSTAPDPVDFRDWQGTNIYDANGASVFTDKEGNRRPLARRGETPVVWYGDFCKMDDVLGRGGQLRSFEAVFSPLDENGKPAKCWDRETGQVNPKIVDYWKRYDISLKLEKEWSQLEPALRGKIHVYMGDLDTFYLEGATRLLGERLKKLGSDAKVELFPGKDHGSLMDKAMRTRIRQEMAEQFKKHHSGE